MNQTKPTQHGSNNGFELTPSDVFFILKRHRIKIVLFLILGAVIGGGIYKEWPDLYQSNAKLLVRYVTEKRDVVDPEGNTRTQSAGGRDSSVLDTELAIIRSLDLALRVAENLDPTLLVSDTDLPEEELQSVLAGLVMSGIVAETAGRGSNIIDLNFVYENPQPTAQILQTVIDTYLAMHVEIHRANGGTFEEYLTQQTDQLRAKLNQTESELLNVLRNAGLIDIVAAKEALAGELARIQQMIRDTELELSINQQRLKELENTQSILAAQAANDNKSAGETNAGDIAENSELSLSEIIEEYENTITLIDILESRERELLLKFTPENGLVKGVREQLAKSEVKIANIESQYPHLFMGEEPMANADPTDLVSPQIALVRANEYRLSALKEQLEKISVSANRVESIELTVKELERRRTLEEANYKNFLTSLEKSRIDEALSAGKINNITIIQNPTPAAKAVSDKIKFAGGAFGGVAAIGFIWAFLVELMIDRSIKRSVDIKRHLGIPLFLALPDTRNKLFRKLAKLSSPTGKQIYGKLKAAGADNSEYTPKSNTLIAASKSNPEVYGKTSSKSSANSEILPWDEGHPLQNYFEALRDRVSGYFESKNLRHKPKLIGFTGLGKDPGVSTIASGVASSLSKTEGGNVLLIDMTLGKESAQQFYKGEEVSDLDEALERPSQAKLNDNLYVVAEGSNGYKLPKLLPSRLNSIIPKLKASDFDYIVFDMPAVSPISPTPRLASFMDVMLMVVESEKTDVDTAQQAIELLSDSTTHLGAILNKVAPQGSKQLESDFVGLS